MHSPQEAPQADIKKALKGLCLEVEQIEQMGIGPEALYEVEYLGVPYGPVFLDHLKELVAFAAPNASTRVRPMGENEWLEIYHHPAFQRRTPQLVPAGQLSAEGQYWVIIDNQKQGPFDLNEVCAMVDSATLIASDMISDDGETWMRLFECEQFDRRGHNHNDLPGLPEWEVFKQSNIEVKGQLDHPSDTAKKIEAIAGLAYIENIKSGKAHVGETTPPKGVPQTQNATEKTGPATEKVPPQGQASKSAQICTGPSSEDSQNIFSALTGKTWFYPAVMAASLFGLISMLLLGGGDSTADKQALLKEKQQERVHQARKDFQRRESVARLPAAAKRKAVAPVKQRKVEKQRKLHSSYNERKPKPFSDTKAFKKRKPEKPMADNAMLDEEDYYYDDSDPVELDPIRQQLSKDTIDPEVNNFEEESESVRAPAAETFTEESWPDPDAVDQTADLFEEENL